jgi:ATP-binding cassette subfamily B protein
LLDELTAHMDRQTENFVLDLLDRLRKDMGILNITHNIRNAALSDKIIVLQDRHMVAAGKHHELMDFENPYSEVWQSFLSSTGS